MPRKPRGKPFPKGQSGNPAGAAAHDQELKRVRRLTHAEIAKVGAMVVEGNTEAIKNAIKDPNSSVLLVWMSTIALKGIQTGDMTKLDGLLSRIVGKTKTEITLTSAESETNPEPKDVEAIEARYRVLHQKMLTNDSNA